MLYPCGLYGGSVGYLGYLGSGRALSSLVPRFLLEFSHSVPEHVLVFPLLVRLNPYVVGAFREGFGDGLVGGALPRLERGCLGLAG